MSCFSSVGRFSDVPHWPLLSVPRGPEYVASFWTDPKDVYKLALTVKFAPVGDGSRSEVQTGLALPVDELFHECFPYGLRFRVPLKKQLKSDASICGSFFVGGFLVA